MNIIQIISNLIMVFSAVLMINAFRISKIRDMKYRFAAAAVNIFLANVISLSGEFNISAVSSVVYPLMFLAAYLIVFGEIKISHIYIALVLESITSILSSCFCVFTDRFMQLIRLDFKTLSLLLVRMIMLLTAIMLNRSKKMRKLGSTIKTIPKHIFIFTALSVLFISLLSENNSFTAEDYLKQHINTILISALTVSLIIMIFSLLINVVAKKQFWEVNELLRGQVEAQLRHYKRLEKLNDDIRSFRHDYINHMHSLISLMEVGQYEDAKEYVEKLVRTSPTQNFSYQTGNFLADAILTDKSDICGEYAKIVFYGFIPDRLDNADLCVMLSNALDNAAEACRDLGGQSSIEVYAQERQGYFALTVRNPTSDVRTYSGIPETTKSDKLNHGFGLRNIEATVKKYDGQLCVKCENMVFELSLTFKI